MTEPPWTVGTEVYKDYGGPDFKGPYKIAKAYKNGNFVLEDSTRQWRPGFEAAFPAGRNISSISSPILILASDPRVPHRLAVARAFKSMRTIEALFDIVRKLGGEEAADRVVRAAPLLRETVQKLREVFTP